MLSLLLPLLALADKDELSNNFGHHEICGGVYGPEDASGPYTPQVKISFPDIKDDTDGEVALLVFSYEDIDNLGFDTINEGQSARKFMCDQDSVYAGECATEQLGSFVVKPNTVHEVLSKKVKISGNDKVDNVIYDVKSTGYYCVGSQATPGHELMKYKVKVHFQNAYGHLPGTDYPLIMFHFVQGLVYLAILLIWLIPLIRFRHSLLKVQKYVTALAALMTLEQLVVALYYFVVNKDGKSAGTKVLLALVAVWGSARLAFTFFLLMIVSCGYSVVHPSLGKKMFWCRVAAGGLFATGTLYSLLDYYESDSEASNSLLSLASTVFFFPFVVAMGINYVMTLHFLGGTVTYLKTRKQIAKIYMYRCLSFILVASLTAVLAQSVVLIIQLLFVSVKDFMITYWQYKWVIYDGWPNIVFCIAFILIMILWRPSNDNMRYAMSTQLSQTENDAEEFEIGSLNGSDEEPEDDVDEGEHYSRRHPYGNNNNNNDAESVHVGARPRTTFDAEANHGLSDLEDHDDFEVSVEDRNMEHDEDPLVEAPSSRLR